MILVANKTDCVNDRIISTQEGEELSKVLKVSPICLYSVIRPPLYNGHSTMPQNNLCYIF